MTHTPPCSTILGQKSLAFWSLRPTGRLVVFIHGFNGGAYTTWQQFPTGLLENESCAGADLLFFGYDSLHQGAEESGVEVFEALNRLWQSPTALINASQYRFAVRSPEFRYTQLTFVAHSLGAAVARQALVEHFRNGGPWGADLRLVLFAPAHKGANAARLGPALLDGLPYLGSAIGAYLQLRYQSVRDLDPDSQFLENLLSESQKALADPERKANYLKAHSVVWAVSDMVVMNQRFLEDPTPKRVRGHSHRSVCKPIGGYDLPVAEVKEALQ